MFEKIIETRNLCKSYGNLQVVDHLSLDVLPGDVYGFLGPNGAGKSTTIRMLLGLVKPGSGQIFIFGKPLESARKSILTEIGCIIEKPDFYRYMSARRNLQLFASLSGKPVTAKRLDEIFELVGLQGREADKAGTYSHGMKQRLGLAQALVHDPQLIILDEPTTGLDPQGIIDIRNLINHLSRDLKKTVFLSSHILSEMELIATRMVIINKGKAIAEGSVKELLLTDELVATFTIENAPVATEALNTSGWKSKWRETNGQKFVFLVAPSEVAELNRFLCENGVLITGIDSRKKLEDYFLNLINKN